MEFSDLTRLASGHVEARIVQAAVQLGIFDCIGSQSMAAHSVASALGLHARATELLLNALAALELLQKRDNRYSLAPVATKHLLRTSTQYLGGMICFDSSLWSCWEKLPEAIRSGQPVRPPNMYQDDPAQTETFITAMDSLVKARGDAEVIANIIDWSGIAELLDVGSGPGTYPIELCRRFPRLRATIFDLPGTLRITERYVREVGMMERIRLIAGDYRNDPIPGVYDSVFLSNIIHGEGEPDNALLVHRLVANLRPGGRLVIKDHILDDSGRTPPVGAIFSLQMLLTTESGRCYSFNEIKSWMEQAGLSKVQEIDLAAPLTSSLVIGTK
ncbi:MAG TPA: methyltransferase [Candidatus Binatia bacterium]|nr:methyltransferase [Candidatus Binatia bacterium]